MKVQARDTDNRIVAKRITAPEARLNPKSGKREALLGYIDAGSYQKHTPTTKDIFLYAAGTNEEGEIPDGLDRLMHHQYVIHLNKRGKAIGIDVIPNRQYRSQVMPRSSEGVKTLTIQYDLDGAVARVTQRPFNMRFEQQAAIIRELDKVIATGKTITSGVRLGGAGRVVNTTENSVEIRMNANPRRVQGDLNHDNYDDLEDGKTEEPAAEAAPATETAATVSE